MRFSIIIPVYNVEDCLEKCVQSVLKQQYSDYEMILVDDGSTDESGILCDGLQQKYPQYIHVIHQENGGLGTARNTGLEHAAGDYILFIDSDDYIENTTLEELSAQIDKTPVDIIHFGARLDRNGDTSKILMDDLPENTVYNLAAMPRQLIGIPNAWCRIFKRQLFLDTNIRFPSRVWYEDIRTTTKLMAKAESMLSMHRPFYYYYVRENSIMNSHNLLRNHEIIDAFDDVLNWFKENNLYEQYQAELCRLAIDHLFLAASVRVLLEDPKHPLLKEFRLYMCQHFPYFQENPYLSQMDKKKRLAFDLLCRQHYSRLQLLFRMKYMLHK